MIPLPPLLGNRLSIVGLTDSSPIE